MHTWFNTPRFPVSRRGTEIAEYDYVPIRLHRRSVPSIVIRPLSNFQQHCVRLPALQTKMATYFLHLKSVSASWEHKRTTTTLLLLYKETFLSWNYDSGMFTLFTRSQQNPDDTTKHVVSMVSEIAYMANAYSHRNFRTRILPPDRINMTNPERG